MSNWKDYPQIFANGKFDFVFRKTNLSFNGFYRTSCLTYGLKAYAVEDCKLIARPISDMSDEECKCLIQWDIDSLDAKMIHMSDKDRVKSVKKSFMEYDIDVYEQHTKDTLYLLSIGVYPFDDDTDVIFKPKNQ